MACLHCLYVAPLALVCPSLKCHFPGSFFPPSFDCPHETERIGALGDGGKWTCGVSRLEHKPDCIIYSFGQFIRVSRSRVHSSTILLKGMYYETSFEAQVVERTRHCQVWGYDYRSTSFGSNKLNNYRAHFFPYGLANMDAHGPHDEHKLYTLKTLMEMNSTVLMTISSCTAF